MGEERESADRVGERKRKRITQMVQRGDNRAAHVSEKENVMLAALTHFN